MKIFIVALLLAIGYAQTEHSWGNDQCDLINEDNKSYLCNGYNRNIVKCELCQDDNAAINDAIRGCKRAQNCTHGCNACGYNWYEVNWNNGNATSSFKNKTCGCCGDDDNISIFDACAEQCSGYTNNTTECCAFPPDTSRNGTTAIYLYEIGYRSCYLNDFHSPQILLLVTAVWGVKILATFLLQDEDDEKKDEKKGVRKKLVKFISSTSQAAIFVWQVYIAVKDAIVDTGIDWEWNTFVIVFFGLLARKATMVVFYDGILLGRRTFLDLVCTNCMQIFVVCVMGFGIMLYFLCALFFIFCILGGTFILPGILFVIPGIVEILALGWLLQLPMLCYYVKYWNEQDRSTGFWYGLNIQYGVMMIMGTFHSLAVWAPFATKYHPWFGSDENKLSILWKSYLESTVDYSELPRSIKLIITEDMLKPEKPDFVVFLSFLSLALSIVESIILKMCCWGKSYYE